MVTYDFGGYATKNDVKCTDGRIIRKGAFQHNDGKTVPLVWRHLRDDMENYIGNVLLEDREDGVYAYGLFNNTPKGQNAKALVEHGDLTSLSIFAVDVSEVGNDVFGGDIKEVSLVGVGANPGAKIDNLSFAHADGSETIDKESAIIYSGLELDSGSIEHESTDGPSLEDVYNTLNEDQKSLVSVLLAQMLEDPEEVEHEMKGEGEVKKNVFESPDKEQTKTKTLTHEMETAILEDAKRTGSLRQSFIQHAVSQDLPNGEAGVDYGIANLDLLFPEYRNVRSEPDFIKRDDAWVAGVIAGTNKTPFSRIKTMTVDVTADVARARGYKKGHKKKEELITMAKRVTDSATIYKKQRLDRDDIIDITSMDIVSFLKSEMQMMLREEIARAILVGDGREALSEDKIPEDRIRPIYKEDALYAYHEEVDMSAEDLSDRYQNLIDSITLAMIDYKGSGRPTLYTTARHHIRMKMVKDKIGRKVYESDSALMDAMGVGAIVDVPVMEGLEDESGKELIAIIVNLKDYTVGTNRGGETTFFSDFDIDFNQYKYLYETRISGALTRVDCALIVETPGE